MDSLSSKRTKENNIYLIYILCRLHQSIKTVCALPKQQTLYDHELNSSVEEKEICVLHGFWHDKKLIHRKVCNAFCQVRVKYKKIEKYEKLSLSLVQVTSE